MEKFNSWLKNVVNASPAVSVTDTQRCTDGLFQNHSTQRSGTKRKSIFFVIWLMWWFSQKKEKKKGENVLFSAMKCVIMSHMLVITRVKFHLLCSFNPALCTSSTLHYMVILWLCAGKQRRAVLSGAQNSICISLYEREVWKSNSSASEDVYVSVCVCTCQYAPGTHYMTCFCRLWLLRKTANRQLFASTEKHVLSMCSAFLRPC